MHLAKFQSCISCAALPTPTGRDSAGCRRIRTVEGQKVDWDPRLPHWEYKTGGFRKSRASGDAERGVGLVFKSLLFWRGKELYLEPALYFPRQRTCHSARWVAMGCTPHARDQLLRSNWELTFFLECKRQKQGRRPPLPLSSLMTERRTGANAGGGGKSLTPVAQGSLSLNHHGYIKAMFLVLRNRCRNCLAAKRLATNSGTCPGSFRLICVALAPGRASRISSSITWAARVPAGCCGNLS